MANMPFSPCPDTSGACTDTSVKVLEAVFGPVISYLAEGADPSSVSPTVNVIATMMSYFNSGVMVVGALILSYVTIMGVLNTANDGEAFGRNWSSTWTPVRIVAGFASLLPTGTGYSFIQLLVMMFSLWAVGLANVVFKAGIENGIIAGSLQNVSQQIGVESGNNGGAQKANKDFPLYNMREMAAGYMAAAYCARTVNQVYADGAATGISSPIVASNLNIRPDRSATEAGIKTVDTYEFKDRNTTAPLAGGNAVCGTVNLFKYEHIRPVPADLAGSAGFMFFIYDDAARDANNQAISLLRDAVLASKLRATRSMMQSIDEWVREWPTDINKNWSNVEVGRFNRIVEGAQSAMLADLRRQMEEDQTLKFLMGKFTNGITKDGWAMAGNYYQRLSGIREEMRKIYSESPGDVTQPALRWLPDDAKGDLVRQTMTMVSVITRKAIDSSGHTPTSITDTANVASIIPSDLDDIDIDQMGSRGNKVMNSFVGNLIESFTNTAIGADGNADALARIKTTGDILSVANSRLHVISGVLKKTGGAVKAAAGAASGVPFVGDSIKGAVDALIGLLEVLIIEPIAQIVPWLDLLAFYFGVFLPSLPYTIFIIAVIGWLLSVVQTICAAPLWAVMHATPDRTFIGSQTQGYLMFLSLFMRPVLIVIALFAAMSLANPIILYVSKAFWAMRTANVSSAESIGFYVQFLTWKNWLIMYGMILLPVVYMIFGLTNTLPDAILTWIGAGIKPLGETQATSEMRAGMERHGVGARESSVSRRLVGGGGGSGQLPSNRGNGSPGSGTHSSENRLVSETGQANPNQVPDNVPSGASTSGSKGNRSSSRQQQSAAPSGSNAGAAAGAGVLIGSAVASQDRDGLDDASSSGPGSGNGTVEKSAKPINSGDGSNASNNASHRSVSGASTPVSSSPETKFDEGREQRRSSGGDDTAVAA